MPMGMALLSYQHRNSFPILNGFALHQFFDNHEGFLASSRILHEIIARSGVDCKLEAVTMKLRRLVKEFRSLKMRKRDLPKLEILLAKEFSPPVTAARKRPAPAASASAPADPEPLVTGGTSVRNDCEKCPGLRKDMSRLDKTWRERCSVLRKERNSVSKMFNRRRINSTLSRKKSSIEKYKTEIAQLKKENTILERRVKALEKSQDQEFTAKYLQKEKQKRRNADIALRKANLRIQELKEQLVSERCYREQLVEESCAAIASQEDGMESKEVETKKAYSEDVRMAIYKCILCNVPVEKAGQLVSFVSDMFGGRTLESTPGPSTVSGMAYELGVISDIQTGEALMVSDSTTLAWDATSIDGVHVNEVHATTSQHKTLYLQVGHLPGGKREDYLCHITGTIKSIAETYAGYAEEDCSDVLQRIYDGITCTLTDRAAVNHCVVEELSLLLNKELIELNCNVHPLDGMASATRKALRRRDSEIGVTSTVYGSECRVANFIYAISKLRYKQGKGDPSGFKIYLQKAGQTTGVIPRYVGNRLHILFHSAGIIFHLKSLLTAYLEKCCTVTQLRLAVLGDFRNEDIMTQLRVLGLFGKYVTGPWMTLFYKNQDGKRHLEMGSYLRICLSHLQQLKDNPTQIVNLDCSVFGIEVGSDDVLQSLLTDGCSDVFCDVVSVVSSAMLEVLNRQLHRYLEGPLSQPSPEMLKQTASAPLNNISGERVLGTFDALFRKAPNASVGFIDGKVKASMNGTLSFVLSKGEHVRTHLIKYATKRAAVIRSQLRQLRKGNLDIAHQRQVSVAQQRDKSARRKVEKEIKQLMVEASSDAILSKLDFPAQDFVASLLRSEIPDAAAFLHVWDVDGEDVSYYGEVKEFKIIRKVCNVVVMYQGSGTSSLPLSELITDVVMGDLVPEPGT